MKSMFISVVGLLPVVSVADPIPISRSQFQSEDFVKSFVGSYGFLSPAEPKVDAEEAALLADLRELFEQGRYREVEAQLVDFIKARRMPVNPEEEPKEVSAAMILALGNLYLQSDRVDDAERAYKLAIERHKSFRRAYKNLGMLYAMKGDMARAYLNLREAIKLGDADHRSFGLIGFYYLQEKRPIAAEGAYRQAYLLNPDEKDWKLGLAQAFLIQEKWEESAALLGELIEESPDNVDLWMRQANCFIELGEKMRAAENLEILRRKDLASPDTLDLLGNLYMDQEQPMLALGAYLAAMKQSEEFDSRRALKTAQILVNFGASAEATKYIEAVRERAGESLPIDELADLLLVEAEAARAQGEAARVGELLDRILEIKPGDGQALVQRGMHLEDIARDAPDPDGRERLYAKAATSFRLALEKPEVAYQANLRYGQMLVRQRMFVEALPYLKAALELTPSENLTQYVRRVERPAARQLEQREREAAERAEAEARTKDSPPVSGASEEPPGGGEEQP